MICITHALQVVRCGAGAPPSQCGIEHRWRVVEADACGPVLVTRAVLPALLAPRGAVP